jgi:hypothetical protein
MDFMQLHPIVQVVLIMAGAFIGWSFICKM